MITLSLTLTLGLLHAAPLLEANAGGDFMAYVGDTVELNGSGYGAEDLEYDWLRLSGPPGELSDPSIPNPQLTPEQSGTYRFALTVRSGGESSVPDEVSVVVVRTDAGTVYAPTGCGLGSGGASVLLLLPVLLAGRRRRGS